MPGTAAPLPATLIAGFGRLALADTIATLLRQKPEHEEWAVLATAGGNELPGPYIERYAPGCPCCTALVPFAIHLTRLLRRIQGVGITRLLIEGGPEGHLASIARLLGGA